MSHRLTDIPIGFFGKIPSRGDFVKSPGQHQLVSSLDRWLAQGMELLAQDARWKWTYESIRPMLFAFMGPQSRFVVAGHLRASCDSSQRRFPFLTAAAFESDEPAALMERGPLALAETWSRLVTLTDDLFASQDSTFALEALGASSVAVELQMGEADTRFREFLDRTSLGQASCQLQASDRAVSLRRVLLALGILLQPVLTSGVTRLDKGLLLPLPDEPFARSMYFGLWMRLITPFLKRTSFEVALFDGVFLGKSGLAIGFNGASPRTLQSVFDPQICAERNIRIDDAEWVETYLDQHYGLGKFASYLEHHNLSLGMVIETFDETFLGA